MKGKPSRNLSLFLSRQLPSHQAYYHNLFSETQNQIQNSMLPGFNLQSKPQDKTRFLYLISHTITKHVKISSLVTCICKNIHASPSS